MTLLSEHPPFHDPERRLRANVAAGVALWSWNVDSDELELDSLATELWGLPIGKNVTFEDLATNIHPSDRDRVRAAFAATRAIMGSYEVDFRIMVDREVRWVCARGKGSDEDISNRTMFGIFLDVTGRKQAEEANELLAGEMSHRVKNLLAIAAGLTNISSRSTTTSEEMAKELTQRLMALGRAHDLVRPLPNGQGSAALLGDLLTVLLAPYDDLGAFSGRIRVSVPRMGVGEAAATTLALVVHELATNSVKYGALSSEGGTLDISCDSPIEVLAIAWTERGGPIVNPPEGVRGFGSRLVDRSVSSQLGGSVDYDWQPTGLVATLRVRADALVG